MVDRPEDSGHLLVGMADSRVFISYSHDSETHDEAVLQLAQQLRAVGIDVQLDRFVPDPAEGWPRWMMGQVDAANLVILVCSDTYRRRFEGQETLGNGRGVTFEGLLALQHLYDADTRNTKFIPVVFEDAGDTAIPLVLRPYTRYTLPRQFDQLYRRLTDQPEVVAAPLGPRKVMPSRATSPAAVSARPSVTATSPSRPSLATTVRSAGSGDVSVTPFETLHHLLLGLFWSGEAFRQWVAKGPEGTTLVTHFPGSTASTAAMVSDGLIRYGHVDDRFFARLTTEFQRRGDDIARVAAVWHSGPSSVDVHVPTAAVPVTHGGFHFNNVSGSVTFQAGGDIVAGNKHVTASARPTPSTAEARRALKALRGALSTSAIEQQKLGRALDDADDEFAAGSPERAEVASALARVLKIVDRVEPDLRATPDVVGPLTALLAWLGPDGELLRS